MIQEYLLARELPDLTGGADASHWPSRRKELLRTLAENIYGAAPAFTDPLYAFTQSRDENAFGGKAISELIRLSFMTPGGMYSFPFTLVLPKAETPVPAFVHIAFSPDVPDKYLPAEELLDAGYAIANLYYNDVTSDSPEADGLARAYPGRDWGKLGMWAFAASRVMDYLLTRSEIDGARVAVTGHSRLGKTALWCGAQDERFALVISNESGCGGAALHRGKVGENVAAISTRFPYWFCSAYAAYAGRERELPFDQHFLLACAAPRLLFVGSASQDEWADPISEFLGAAAASQAYALLGVKGLETPDARPALDSPLLAGRIGYLERRGTHAFTRADWLAHLRFRELHHV